ncbi:uncharacterized protein LOC116529584 [Sapajus apella]|uniref:Uncharacterized protein LOC116529584 n=1 Tax=Sapajus apella TaxID=9515 RepID=A0A6J3FD02_SAPAP|nr:uncharacterized protein LOC116529584 [Sapajus apella]
MRENSCETVIPSSEGLLNSCPAGGVHNSLPDSSSPFRSPRLPLRRLPESGLLLGPGSLTGIMEFSEMTLCVPGHHLLLGVGGVVSGPVAAVANSCPSPGRGQRVPERASKFRCPKRGATRFPDWALRSRAPSPCVMQEGTILPLARDTKPGPVPPRVACDSGTITLRCKDLRVLQLEIEDGEATLDIARSIEVLSSLELPITSCPFYHPKGLRLNDSWHFLSPERYKLVALEVNAVVEARGGGSWARKRRGKSTPWVP